MKFRKDHKVYKPTRLDTQIATLKNVANHLKSGGSIMSMPINSINLTCSVCGVRPSNTNDAIYINDGGLCPACLRRNQ